LSMDEESLGNVVAMTSALRKAGIRASSYPTAAKLKKQMKYAADLQVAYVLMAGEDERANGAWTVRHMETGNQQQLPTADAIRHILSGL